MAMHGCGAAALGAWDQVNCYCERALDPGFWAEPLNAVSNIAILVAALMAYTDLRAARPKEGSGALMGLILLVMLIATGSFLFHTLATKWARLADIIPITLFIFAYFMLALHRLVGLNRLVAIVLAIVVAALGNFMPPWLNGSFGYAPVLLSMLIVGLILVTREHGAGAWILTAGGIFAVSLVLRTLDGGAGCFLLPPGADSPSFTIGTHPLWHILNAVVLYLLLRALISARAGDKARL